MIMQRQGKKLNKILLNENLLKNISLNFSIFLLQKLKIIRGYVGIHTTSFKDFLLREQLQKSIATSGFEHPSEGKKIKKYLS